METKEEGVGKEESHTNDTLVEEDKIEQSPSVIRTTFPTNDMGTIESHIIVVLLVNDDVNGEPWIEVNIKQSKLDTSLANLMATYFEESE